MWEYIDWLFGYSYLAFPSFKTISLYSILAVVLCPVMILIYLRFFHLPAIKQEEEEGVRITKEDRGLLNIMYIIGKLLFFITAIFVAPLVEEVVYRGPILWFVQKSQWFYVFLAFLVSVLAFMVAHVFDIIKRPKSIVYNIGCGAVFYGGLVIVTASLWPSILLHMCWNIFATIMIVRGKEKLDCYAQSLQR